MSRNISKAGDLVLGSLGRSIPPSKTLDHWVRYLSTYDGADKLFMLVQHGSKLLVPLLAAKSSGRGGLTRLSNLISNSRALWRLWGLLPIIQWLSALERTPSSSRSLTRLQAFSLLAYYPLEHLSYLSSNKIIPLHPRLAAKFSLWSARAWAAYVVMQVWRDWRELNGTWSAKGKEREVGSAKERLDVVKRDLVINLAYLPLTIHWSLPNGLIRNEVLVNFLGLIAAIGSFKSGWEAVRLGSA